MLFLFNDTTTTEIYTLSLHAALPIYRGPPDQLGIADVPVPRERRVGDVRVVHDGRAPHDRRGSASGDGHGGVGPVAGLGAIEWTACRPSRRGLIVSVARRLAGGRVTAPAGERGPDVDRQRLDAVERPESLS